MTADTNVLLRVIVGDDLAQAARAEAALDEADLVSIPSAVLCELVWVLSKGYRRASAEIATVITGFMNAANVAMNRPAVSAGLALLRDGGDFADGVIAFEGYSLGADVFASFDQTAVKLLQAQGRSAKLLA